MDRSQNIDRIRIRLDFINQAVVVPIPDHLTIDCSGAQNKEDQDEQTA